MAKINPAFPMVWIVLLGAFAAAQQGDPNPVLRVSNYTVVVDVVVTDKSSRYLTDLELGDFEVYEGEVLQELESLTPVSGRQVDRPSDVRLLSDSEHPALLEPQVEPGDPTIPHSVRPNLIIMLLDYATVEYLNQNYIREAAVRWVRERLQPNDVMAVFQVGMSLKFLQNFTNDKEKLVGAISRMDPTGSSYAADQSRVSELAGAAQVQAETLSAQINVLGQALGRGGAEIAVLIELLNNEFERTQALEGLYYAQLSYSREQQSRPIIGAIETIADGVKQIPGRKTLILFSEGFSVPATLEKPLFRAVEKASRSNLAVYAIDGAGLQVKARSLDPELQEISAEKPGDRVKAYGGLSLFDRAREVGSDMKDSSLRFLASSTGGMLIRHTNDFFHALERIDEEVRSHYLLTYRPSNLNFDGEFRPIRVVVKRRGARVRARSGYWAVPPGASMLSADDFRTLVQRGGPERQQNHGLGVYAHPTFFRDGNGRYLVNLTVEVPFSEIKVQTQDGQPFADLHLVGYVENREGEVVTSFRAPPVVPLVPVKEDSSHFIRMESGFNLAPGVYSIRLHLQDNGSNRGTYRQMSLALPAVPDGLSLSSLVLGDVLGNRSDPTGFVPRLGDLEVYPSARRSFLNGERLLYYLAVYPQDPVPVPEDLEVTLSVLQGGKEVSSTTEKAGSSQLEPLPHVALARYLELDGLKPGDYYLKASVYDRRSDRSLSAQTSFRIEQ